MECEDLYNTVCVRPPTERPSIVPIFISVAEPIRNPGQKPRRRFGLVPSELVWRLERAGGVVIRQPRLRLCSGLYRGTRQCAARLVAGVRGSFGSCWACGGQRGVEKRHERRIRIGGRSGHLAECGENKMNSVCRSIGILYSRVLTGKSGRPRPSASPDLVPSATSPQC